MYRPGLGRRRCLGPGHEVVRGLSGKIRSLCRWPRCAVLGRGSDVCWRELQCGRLVMVRDPGCCGVAVGGGVRWGSKDLEAGLLGGDPASDLALCVGVAGFEPTTSSSRTKRAAKLRYTPVVAAREVYVLPAPSTP